MGMTRARDRLFLTAANYYGEGKREKKLSPFVIEVLGEEATRDQQPVTSDQLTFLDWQKPKEDLLTTTDFRPPISYLDFSRVESFDTCPRQYHLRYIRRIPVPPTAPLSFGSSIHRTLRDFYQKVKEGKKLSEKELLGLLDINWSPEGYDDKTYEELRKKQGQRILSDFYKQTDPKVVPKDLEQFFVIKVSPKLKIGGRIDRVDQKGKKLEIIDYKTGKVMEQEEIDKSLQMTVYALVATDKGIYGKKPEEVVLTFYFLDTGEKKSTKRAAEDLKKAKKELIEKAKKIEKSEFQPTPGYWCKRCEFKFLCDAATLGARGAGDIW